MVERSTGITEQQIQDMMDEGQYWAPTQMQNYQRSQISQLLQHAKKTTPFYKTRLDCMFKSDGSIDWTQWRNIPILTRKNLRFDRADLLASDMPQGHGRTDTFSTSGTTGHRIEVTFSALLTPIGAANWRRYFMAQELPEGLRTARIDFLPEGADPKIEIWQAGERSLYWFPDIMINRALTPLRKLQLLAEYKIQALHEMSNNTEILARENLRQKFGLRMQFIMGTGMEFLPEQRKLVHESFGARCMTPYSSKENAMMAFPCREGNYHVCSESVLLEILDDDDQPCPPGKTGHVVVTNIFNAAQPTIRYRQGDKAAWGGECRCGRELPVISEIQGRTDAIWHFPDREVSLPGVYFSKLTKHLDGDAFQLAQIGPLELELRYISSSKVKQSQQRALQHDIAEYVHPEVKLSFKRVDDIPYGATGKQQRYVREWNA